MPDKIAILLVHGIESAGEGLTDTAEELLAEMFDEQSDMRAEDVLVVRTAHWVPVLSEHQDRMVARLAGGERTACLFRWLGRMGARISAGCALATLPVAAAGLVRWIPGLGDFHWPVMRWLAVQYVGDAIAYQGRSSPVYGRVHGVVAQSLDELAKAAGRDAPLVVIAHSLGAVIIGNYLYDLQAERIYGSGPALPAEVRAIQPDSPLERGKTLARLYTLGSPLTLYTFGWSEQDLDRPVVVPDPAIAERLGSESGWTNVYDPDDVIAAPLAVISPSYACRVRDERVRVGPLSLGATPLAHLFYWNDRTVMRPIGRELAQLAASLLRS